MREGSHPFRRVNIQEVRVGGETTGRFRLSVQEHPPNDWYVCVLCGRGFDRDDGRKHFCIKVVQDGDVTFLPVHTDCVNDGVGDRAVWRTIRRYSTIVRKKLIETKRRREEEGREA